MTEGKPPKGIGIRKLDGSALVLQARRRRPSFQERALLCRNPQGLV
jgi:hypothetical protein